MSTSARATLIVAWDSAVELTDLFHRRLLFVTGKGGTGKTATAAALALAAASRGLRTLVCDMDAKGDLAKALGADPFRFTATEISPRLFGMAMDTEQSLREYLRLFVRIPVITSVGPLASTLDFVADAAPGVKEVLAVGKLCWEVREKNYDMVIVDAEASGHIVSQIAAPRVLQRLVRLGLIREQSDWMIDILEDRDTTGVVVVTTPEELPVTETLALIDRVRAETRVDVASVIVNRCPSPVLEGAAAPFVARARTERVAIEQMGEEAALLLSMLEFHAVRREESIAEIATLREGCGDIDVVVVPDLASSTDVAADLSAVLMEELA